MLKQKEQTERREERGGNIQSSCRQINCIHILATAKGVAMKKNGKENVQLMK